MLEIVIMVAVVGWFYRTAKQIGANGYLWGALGALSYYVPMLLSALFVFPFVVDRDMWFLGVLLSVAVGIACCVGLRMVLKSKVQAHYNAQNPQQSAQ